jgi:hypothetical protein
VIFSQLPVKETTMTFRLALLAAVMAAFGLSQVQAFEQLPRYLKDGFKEDAAYKPFLETVEGLKTKCDVCHIPGANKKAKGHGLNDFGKVYHDRFKHKDFTAADEAKKHEEAMKIFKDAWEKSVIEKNAEGKVYLELIKAGKLPGKND